MTNADGLRFCEMVCPAAVAAVLIDVAGKYAG